MSTEDFIAACLMVPTDFIDELCDEYDVDFGEDEIFDMLNCCAGDVFHEHNYRRFGELLVSHVVGEVVELYSDVLDAGKFDYEICGSSSAIYYDEERIENKEQLDEIYNKELERKSDKD